MKTGHKIQNRTKKYHISILKIVFHICLIYNILNMINNFEQNQDDQEANIKITNLWEKSVCTYIYSYPRIYSVISENNSYILKVFPVHKVKEYQKERYILEALNHPNIIQPIGSSEQIVRSISSQLRHGALVFPVAKFGNFLKYLNTFGSFSEEVTKNYLQKIVRALKYAKDKLGFIHENLSLQNLLMKQDKDVLICGWSNSMKNTEKPVNFVIARLAIQMITQRDPFSLREIKASPYYKFLNDKHIHKFWDQIEKL